MIEIQGIFNKLTCGLTLFLLDVFHIMNILRNKLNFLYAICSVKADNTQVFYRNISLEL